MTTLDILKNLLLNALNNTAKAEPIKKTNYVGFCGGLTYGLGFTYKKLFGKYGFQVSGLPYMTDSKNNFFAGGGTGFITLNEGNYGSLFLSLGTGAFRRKSTYTISEPVPGTVNTDGSQLPDIKPEYKEKIIEDISGGLAAGPAIGIEYTFAENFALSIELPIAFIFRYANNTNTGESGFGFTSILPIPNISLLYRF
jgi:hypothetical protein